MPVEKTLIHPHFGAALPRLRDVKSETEDDREPCMPGASGRTVIVAGGAGFLGSHLCDRQIAAGHRVICVDNLSTGRRENISHLMDHPCFAFVLHDIVEPFELLEDVAQIYNLACPASPPKYQIDPLHTFKTSVFGALNLLRIAEEKGARILQASTSEIYGDPEVTPQPESYRGLVNTIGPRSCYDEGKRAAETVFHDTHEERGVDIRIARIFNTYGPRMDPEDGRVVSNFIMQALTGETLTIYGSGQQTRSFCYVDDLIDGLIALMNSDKVGPDPVNLGNPGEFTIAQLADIVLQMTGTQSTVSYRELPRDDPRQRRPDITRAKAVLGWAPKVPLREGLVPTIAYFMSEVARNARNKPEERLA